MRGRSSATPARWARCTQLSNATPSPGPLGFTSYGAIVPWIPLFMFVFLFGLSMDYHVFILSRIKELRSRGASTPAAVVAGIASSAGVVTSAAVIMVSVFSIFATLSLIQLQILGVVSRLRC
jgi:putative drug exporter of the RND superfamily